MLSPILRLVPISICLIANIFTIHQLSASSGYGPFMDPGLVRDSTSIDDVNIKPTNVKGKILTPSGHTIKGTKVNIVGAELSHFTETDISGHYAFVDVTTESEIEVTVQKNGLYTEGVNSLDLIRLQRHLLQVEIISSPYQILAADINNDNVISESDLKMLRSLILGNVNEEDMPDSWRFVQKGTSDSFITVDQGETINNGDFLGVKIGDVDSTIDDYLSDSKKEKTRDFLGLVASDVLFIKDEVFSVPVIISRDMAIQAMQLTIQYDPKVLDLVDIKGQTLSITPNQISSTIPGYITMVWTEIQPFPLVGGDIILALKFKAAKYGTLDSSLDINSSFTKAVAFDESGKEYEVNLDFIPSEGLDISLYQNKPNPFIHETLIELDLPEAMEVNFKVVDSSNKVYWSNDLYYPAGKNTLTLGDELLGLTGVFYLKMEAPEFTQVIKMIKIE